MELFQGVFAAALIKFSPLLFCSLAVALSFRAGLWNIGAEGQFLVGAIGATFIGTQIPQAVSSVWIIPTLLAATCAGALWGFVAAFLRVTRHVPEVITTLLLNFIAIELVSYLVHGPFQESAKSYPISDTIQSNLMLPLFGEDQILHAGIILAVAAALAVYLFIVRTTHGYQLRALGQNETAVIVAGFSVKKIELLTFLGSGALAGLGGGIEILGVTHRLFERISPGYGFAAIAIALLGRLHPLWIIASSFFFALLYAGSSVLERLYQIPSVTLYGAQAVVIFLVLAAGVKNGTVKYGY